MTRFLSIFFVVCFCISHAGDDARAEDNSVLIMAFPKEGRLERDGSGHYGDMIRAVLGASTQPADFVVLPVKRLLRQFEQGGPVCIVPAAFSRWRNHFPALSPEDVVESEPIDYVSAHIVTRTGDKTITDLKELAGKRLGVWVGVGIEHFLTGIDVELFQAESEESNIHMLMAGRVDAIWSWVPDAPILFERLGYAAPNLVENDPVFGSSTHFFCRRTTATETFIRDADAIIRGMRESGVLKMVLGPHSRVVGVDVPLSVAENQ